MKKIYRLLNLLLVVLLAGCSGLNLPFGSQSSEPRPMMLYCEYAISHDRIQFTSDGQYLLSGNCLWPMSSPVRERPVMNLNSKPVEKKNEIVNNLAKNTYRFFPSPSNEVVVVLDMNGNARLITLKTRTLSELPEIGKVNTVLFTPDGRLVTRDAQSINVWDLTTLQRLFGPLATDAGPLNADGLQLSPDGKLLAAWSGAALDLFDLSSGSYVRRLGPAQSGAVRAVAFTPDSQTIAVARADGTIEVYALASGEVRTSIAAGEGALIDKLLFSPDATRLAASAANLRQLGIWQADDGALVQNLQMPPVTIGEIFQWSILPGGQLFVVFSDGLVTAWSLADGKELYSVQKAKVAARTIVVWPDFSKYAVFQGNLTIYQASDGSQVSLENVLESQTWKRATGISSGDLDVESMALSPDLKHIVIQLINQNAILWPIN